MCETRAKHTHIRKHKSQNAKKKTEEKQKKKNCERPTESRCVALRFCYVVERATCKTQLSQARSAARERSADGDRERAKKKSGQRRKKNRYTTVTSIGCDSFTCSLSLSLARLALPDVRNSKQVIWQLRQQLSIGLRNSTLLPRLVY